MPTPSGVNLGGKEQPCNNLSNTTHFSGSWFSNVLDKVKFSYSVRKYLHQLQKAYYTKITRCEALSLCECSASHYIDTVNSVFNGVQVVSQSTQDLSTEEYYESFHKNQTAMYFPKVSSVVSEADSLNWLMLNNLKPLTLINAIDGLVGETVERTPVSVTFKLNPQAMNCSSLQPYPILAHHHRHSVSNRPTLTMINGFPYFRVAPKYRYVDIMRSSWLNRQYQENIDKQEGSINGSIVRVTDVLLKKSEDICLTEKQSASIVMTEKESKLQASGSKVRESRMIPINTCTPIIKSQVDDTPAETTHLQLNSCELKAENYLVNGMSTCRSKICDTSSDAIKPTCNESYNKPDENIIFCDVPSDFENEFTGSSDDSEDENNDDDDIDDDYIDDSNTNALHIHSRTARSCDSDSSSDLECDGECDSDNESVKFGAPSPNYPKSKTVNRSIGIVNPGSIDRVPRSLFVCPTDSEGGESSDEAEDDDDDNWNNPSTTIATGCDLGKAFNCFSSLYIPQQFSPDNNDTKQDQSVSVSTAGCHCGISQLLRCVHQITTGQSDLHAENGYVFNSVSSDNKGRIDKENEREATDEERVLMDVNYRWSTFYSNEVHESSELEATDEHCSSKMVRFTTEEDIQIPVLNEIEWAEDYAAARIGTYVIDQIRFKHRVRELEQALGLVLNRAHQRNVHNVVQHSEEELLVIERRSAAVA